jgi:hypothetical protein
LQTISIRHGARELHLRIGKPSKDRAFQQCFGETHTMLPAPAQESMFVESAAIELGHA